MRYLASAAMFLLITASAAAQQPQQCKSYYPLGEAVPAGCGRTFDSWSAGQPVAPSKGSPPPPTILDNARTFGLGVR